MFICDECERPSQPCETMVKRTIIVKTVYHPEHTYKDKHKRTIHDPGGQGTQIVKEGKLCQSCAYGGSVDKLKAKFNAPIDEVRPAKMPTSQPVLA